jgi:hypothetical protein
MQIDCSDFRGFCMRLICLLNFLQVTERDDRMLMEQLTALEAANKEVAGDTDSEDDDDTGDNS